MLEQPVIIYSEYCAHSATFLNILLKHPQIDESFVKINIDIDPRTRQRPPIFYDLQYKLNHPISEVPTIIVEGGEYILSGEEAFKWLDYTIQKLIKEEPEELSPFNPNEMGAFSDCYSQFGSNSMHDATEQSFKFLDKQEQRINTPQEDGTATQDDYSKKQRERELNFNAQRNETPPSRKLGNGRIDFTNSGMGFSGQINGGCDQKGGQQFSRGGGQQQFGGQMGQMGQGGQMGRGGARPSKEDEMDMKLQELLQQRETTVPPVKRPPNKRVNFATGN